MKHIQDHKGIVHSVKKRDDMSACAFKPHCRDRWMQGRITKKKTCCIGCIDVAGKH